MSDGYTYTSLTARRGEPVRIDVSFHLDDSAWLAVPARVCDIEHQYIGTATGLMLTLAAVGGFFIPIIFGHLVPHTSFDTGWIFLAVVSFAFALLGLAGRNPAAASKRPGAGAPAPARL